MFQTEQLIIETFRCNRRVGVFQDIKVCDYPYRVECNGVPTNPIPPEPVTEQELEATTNVPTEPSSPPSPPPPPPQPPQPPQLPQSPAPVHEAETPVALEPAASPAVATPEGYYTLKKVPAGKFKV